MDSTYYILKLWDILKEFEERIGADETLKNDMDTLGVLDAVKDNLEDFETSLDILEERIEGKE